MAPQSVILAIIQSGLAPTMFWVYAATALLVVLFVLLVAPYMGIYGDRDVTVETGSTENAETPEGLR